MEWSFELKAQHIEFDKSLRRKLSVDTFEDTGDFPGSSRPSSAPVIPVPFIAVQDLVGQAWVPVSLMRR
jgi:hypothetical protein